MNTLKKKKCTGCEGFNPFNNGFGSKEMTRYICNSVCMGYTNRLVFGLQHIYIGSMKSFVFGGCSKGHLGS